MIEFEKMKNDIQQFINKASDFQILNLHRIVVKLQNKAANLPKQIQLVREPKIVIVKDWWTNLSDEQLLTIDGAIDQLDSGKEINKIKMSKLPSWVVEKYFWANSAITSFNTIVDQIETENKNANPFINSTLSTLELLRLQPQLGETSIHKRDVRMIKLQGRFALIYRFSSQIGGLELIQFVKR